MNAVVAEKVVELSRKELSDPFAVFDGSCHCP